MATGDTLLIFTAESARIPSSSGGFLEARNGHPVVSLTTGGDIVNFGAVLPRNYAGGGITVYLHYAMNTAVANNIQFSTAFERVGDGSQDTDSDGFATANNSGDVVVPATAGNVDIANIAHTNGAQIDSVAVGEYFRLQVKRIATSGTDATGEAHLFAIELKET